MADQATSMESRGASAAAANPAHGGEQHLEHNGGSRVSWAGVIVAIAGSIVGGWSFMPPVAPPVSWPMFWAGCAVFVVGLLIMGVAKTFSKDWY